MQTHDFFIQLLAILLFARIFAEIATRWGAPSVIGELVAGVALGPSLLGWISPVELFKLLAEIGIILLLFQVGLETDARRLIRAGRKSVIVALLGFFLPLLLGFLVAWHFFGIRPLIALFIGGTLTATSIGITVRVLADLHRQHSEEGQIVLGAAVLDDVLGVILLALLYEYSVGGGVSLINTGKVVAFVAVFFVLAPIMAKLIAGIIRHFDTVSELPGLIPTTIVALVLFFAWLAHLMGAPELLGGFAAGLALSRRFFLPFGASLHTDPAFSEKIEKQMLPIISLFAPIFFVVVGLSLNMKAIDWSSSFIWTFSASLLGIAIFGKLAGAMMLHENWPTRWMIGTAMIPRGEVGLIFAELGRFNGILSNEVYAALLIVIAVTTLMTPFVMKALYSHFSSAFKA
ncbi:MAG TPA: cation:proton antiporter [Chromatiales bacterium]|nr:cation:proton antiporter [Thiotrichales bacterium]HIP67600.1 cation:proton antiporter [Chromatiales bacterium]